MITKAIDLSVKDIDLSKREAVIAHATYKSLDGDGDRSNRGMFDKSWKESFNLLRFFLNHKKDQAPGKALKAWDDGDHAYTHVKLGTHTLGEDVLKMLDEGVIVAASFGFDPIKMKDIKGKGKDFLEVKHYETSVLTHWGAHVSSGPVAVMKQMGAMPFTLKQLSQVEQDLLMTLLANDMQSLQTALTVATDLEPSSDLYQFVMWFISRRAEIVANLRSELKWGMKEKVEAQVLKMQRFIRNSSASDDCINDITKSLNILLNKNSDTALSTDTSLRKCPSCATYNPGITDDLGNTKCAECNHLITKGSQPEASRNKEEVKVRLLRLKAQMAMTGSD